MTTRDVRMSGFRSRSTVAEATSWLDGFVGRRELECEAIQISAAFGRCLAESVVSTIDVPGFDRSAMDGYAVKGDETTGASDYQPLQFKVIGQSLPGNGFAGELQSRQAIQIMTGAPIPRGADAVVPVEYTERIGEQVTVTTAVAPGKHVGRQGEDIRTGAVVVDAGRILRPQDVAVIASVGQATVTVRKQPRVRILVTGNELVHAGEEKQPHQIYEANSSLLLGLVPRDGGEVESLRFVEDTQQAISEALLEPGADVILVSGGSSVGAEDFAPSLVREHGVLPIHGVAMRPSSPTGLGHIGSTLVCLLPGNPVSCMCAYDFFAGRAIRQLAGCIAGWPHQAVNVTLTKKIASAIGRVDYCRVKAEGDSATPLAISGASILSSTTRADGFVIVPEESEGFAEGQEVMVYLYR